MGRASLVCVVDDDESVRESFPALLGAASADLARAACLILDVRMPGMSSPKLRRRSDRAES